MVPKTDVDFLLGYYGGYLSFSNIDDGSMLSMVQPGSSGYGLHLGTIADRPCCNGWYTRASATNWRGPDQPWFIPTIVQWSSPVNDDFLIYQEVIQEYADDFSVDGTNVIGPQLLVSEGHYEMSWYFDNVFVSSNMEYRLEDPFMTPIGPAIGLIPAWEVTPLNDDIVRQVSEELHHIYNKHDLYMLEYCWCSVDSETVPVYEETVNEFGETHKSISGYCAGHTPKCKYKYLDAVCSCGLEPTDAQRFEAFHDEMPDLTKGYSKEFEALIAQAAERSINGWEHLYNILEDYTNPGDICSTWYWQRRSPYSLSCGPRMQMQQQLLNSMSSGMRRVS